MLFAYAASAGGLRPLADDEPLQGAVWIDLYRPTDAQVARLAEIGVAVPSLEDMEEIEISNRLYREDGADFMTVVLPGQRPDKTQTTGPVCFILSPGRLVTVRHHAPRPFETFPARADKGSAGCGSAALVFLGLIEEILGRQADLLEGAGKAIDATVTAVFATGAAGQARQLQAALRQIVADGEIVSRVRMSLMTVERALSYHSLMLTDAAEARGLRSLTKARLRDLQALEVHADFLAGRLTFTSDATLGMINLGQNVTVRILSVVAVLFSPPMLVASIYGMNFRAMPELDWPWGYPVALLAMVASAAGSWLYFRRKNWL